MVRPLVRRRVTTYSENYDKKSLSIIRAFRTYVLLLSDLSLFTTKLSSSTETHNTLSTADFRTILGNIFAVNGSVNFYMFHGGTNFGYMNGGNILGKALHLLVQLSVHFTAVC
jgi:hypothetical protein